MPGEMIRVVVCLVVFVIGLVSSVTKLDPVSVKPGESAKLTCSTGNPPNTPVVWSRNGKDIKADQKYNLNTNDTLAYLTINVIVASDLGEYTCNTSREIFTIDVVSSPYANRLPKSFNYVVGEMATISCFGWGSPPVKIIWSRAMNEGDAPIAISNDTGRVGISEVSQGTNVSSLLVIVDLQYTDYAIYYCSVNNSYAPDYTVSTKVRVKDKLAPLWPFIGIVAEIIILVIIIIIYEKRKAKQSEEDEAKEKADFQTNANDHKDEASVRFRK